uniref:Rhs element Vgr protein n=1 Tax=Panagrolaimus davidi TaxID=227884 RepID=A0A914PRS0_9BILA
MENPAHFDAERGVLWDGKTAHFYAPVGQQGFGGQQGGLSSQQSNILTAIETTAQGNIRITLGNGTHGDLREHAMHPSSNYVLDSRGLYL